MTGAQEIAEDAVIRMVNISTSIVSLTDQGGVSQHMTVSHHAEAIVLCLTVIQG